jgi:hypothetical protein
MVFASCKKDDNTDSTKVYNDSKGTTISITNSQWFTTTKGNSSSSIGYVNLLLSGSTNADKVTVRTFGDGIINDEDVVLDSKRTFNKDTIGISFMHYSSNPPSDEFESSTIIKAYKGTDTLVITLNSGKLKY